MPVTFAQAKGALWIPVDGKPKRHRQLRRLANIRANPRVCLLIDHYEEDWRELWWVRVDGTAALVQRDAAAQRALAAKYPQYADVPIWSLIKVDIERISHWQGAGA